MSWQRATLVGVVLTAACSEAAPEVNRDILAAEVRLLGGHVDLSDGFEVTLETPELQPLVPIFESNFFLLTGVDNGATSGGVGLDLGLDMELDSEEYRLRVADSIRLEGGSYAAVSFGLVTLMQSLDPDGSVPRMEVRDAPASPYRGVMLDLARAWHDPSTIRDVITLARWYKLNYVHLHLTDDQSFTFPSQAFPELATEGRSYSTDQLSELNKFARERGIKLVPEIDVPGHATQFVRQRPDVFAIGDSSANPYTIAMGRERTYQALDALIGEVAEAFPDSPYIHIGGDEAFFAGMDSDPETIEYMAAHGLSELDDLFRHFLGRINEMVKDRSRRTIVWAGFAEEGAVEVPRDIVVMHWEAQYYDPQRLLDDGFEVINASFKPLYVVNNRKWDPAYIYSHWNPRRWESWAIDSSEFAGLEVGPSNQILGASMSAWEQHQTNQVPRLRRRLPAMAAHVWLDPVPSEERFTAWSAAADAALGSLLHPYEISTAGLMFPDAGEGLFLEQGWFSDRVTVSARPRRPGLTLRYALDASEVRPDAEILTSLEIDRTATLLVQAFDADSLPVGAPYRRVFTLKPVTAAVDGIWKDLPPGSWEKHRFEDVLEVSFRAARSGGAIHYTVDGTSPQTSSARYAEPLTIRRTTRVRARWFDEAGLPQGEEFAQIYYEIVQQSSLTTGKPIWATNESDRPGLAGLANNGRVTLWEQWGGHVGEGVGLTVDLENPVTVRRLQVQNFWDGRRYYQYTIDGSLDGEQWEALVDHSGNTDIATIDGYVHEIAPAEVRYLRLNLLYNSANPGLHVVEFSAFE